MIDNDEKAIKARLYDVSIRMLALEKEYQDALEALHTDKVDCLHKKITVFDQFWDEVIQRAKEYVNVGLDGTTRFCNTLALWIALSRDRSIRIQNQLVALEGLEAKKDNGGVQ